ncbi:MAG TPA: glycosyltransferase family 4 protein [Candidatus Acidoferrales bacterium]
MNARAHESAPGWLFVLPWSLRHTGGVNEVVKSLIIEFRSDGTYCPYLLCAPDDSMITDPDLINPLFLDFWSPVDHEKPLRGWISFIARLPHRCWTMRKIIRRDKIRVINPHFPDLGALSFLILKKIKLFNGELILSFHLSDIKASQSAQGVERWLWRILLRGADSIVAVSDDSGANILRLDPSIAKKLVTIRNGVDLALFSSSDAAATAQHLAPGHEKTVLSVGAFIPRKGHDVLVRAFDLLLQTVPDARLTIVGGDGSEFEPLGRLIDSLGLNDKIRLCKDVPHDQIPAFLSQSQLFVLASLQEGHPLAVVEAGAAGLPIVCTQGAWSQELITDGLTGRLFAQGDERALAAAMADLFTNNKEARQMAARFHEYVKKNLTWEHSYKKYLQLGGEAAGRFPRANMPSTSDACVVEKTAP